MNAHLAVHLQVVCMEIWTTPITRTRPCSAALVVAMLKQYQHCPVHTLHINGRDNLCDIDTYRHIHLTCWHTDVNYLCDPERSTSCAYFVVKGRVPTIPLKLHSLGPLNHTCPFCRSSQIFINIPLLPSRYHLFDFLVCIFHPCDQVILWSRIRCLVLPNCQDSRIFLWSKQDHVLPTSLSSRWQSILQSRHIYGVGWGTVLKTKYICWTLMHGWMQNSSGDDSGTVSGLWYQMSQTDALWNLHCGWSHICNVGPLRVPEINLWDDLPASMREILTRSVWLIISKSQINTYIPWPFHK